MKSILMNKKGFTLLEILVTVGIVGVLSAVAVPAYNQYKRGTIETAVESDIGNFQKAYMAFNAIHGTYCTDFAGAGIKMRDLRNYKKSGIIGFSDINSSCGGTPANALAVQRSGENGTCSDVTKTKASDCTGSWDHDSDSNTPDEARNWAGTAAGTLSNCELDVDQFLMGATTNVSAIEKMWAINEEGKIADSESAGIGAADCSNADLNF